MAAFGKGLARLTVVAVVVSELVFALNIYSLMGERDDAVSRQAEWISPPPVVENEPLTADDFINPPSAEEAVKTASKYTDRMAYDLAVGDLETAEKNLRLAIWGSISFPFVVAIIFFVCAWVINGFRRKET